MARGSNVSHRMLDQLMESGGYRCAECGIIGTRVRRKFTKRWCVSFPTAAENVFLSADHIIPQSKGGTMSLENLRILCTLCNSLRGASLDLRPTLAAEEHW